LDANHRIARIEALIHRDVGRNVAPLMRSAVGGLAGAAQVLAGARGVGIMTGFFVPGGEVPAAETDGPAGAALLALAFSRAGLAVRLLTDPPCAQACRVALRAAGASAVPVDVMGEAASIIATWRSAGIDAALAIERCGRTSDGTLRNMRGEIVTDAVPLDDVFLAGPWRRLAIGDGGNEIGMARLPLDLIASHVAHGATIACVTPADHLVMAGVSHWGAWALLAALAVSRPDWSERLVAILDESLDQSIVEAMVRDGPAVDGLTRRRMATIDGLALTTHHALLAEIRAVAVPPVG
jgi:hypothetical protein